jgi:TolB-like protein/Flp pilus assembly protein TadD
MAGEFRVGEWLIEPDLNRASNGTSAILIEPKVLEVLKRLAEHPGEVLSKETIIRDVWPGIYVSDGILTYSISELRKALKDDARNPHIIQTISRKGYRLIAPVSFPASDRKPQPSIAILAFFDMSPEKDQQHFCDGLAEEIINGLTQVNGVRVAARTSSFAFKGKDEDVRAIGRRLGVATVLEGSVRKAGDQMRITAQLIKTEDGCHLWADRYDQQVRDVFAIQDEISKSIVASLRAALIADEKRAPGDAADGDPQAYDYCLRAKQFFCRCRRRDVEFALRMFAQAAEIDPHFARAHAGVAACHAFLYLCGGGSETHRARAEAASRKAVELDPNLAEAHVSRGLALSLHAEYRDAERAFEAALRLSPGLFEAYYFFARIAYVQGKLEKALELYERAGAIRPRDYQAPLLAAQIYSDLGRGAEADAARRRGVQMASACLRLNPDDARALYMGGNGLAALGERERALEWARQALEIDPNDPLLLYNVACIQTLAGQIDEALDSLARSVQNGLSERRWLELDSSLEPLRPLPRYGEILARIEAFA